MNPKPPIKHVFLFNPDKNGGEALLLTTELTTTGLLIQELSLYSYGNSATFTTSDMFTPSILRELADELEAWLIKTKKDRKDG